MQCNRCNRQLTEDQSYMHQEKVFCEDCLMDVGLSLKECDPWATYVDTRTRAHSGYKGTEGLTETEKKVYDHVKNKGKITREEVMVDLNLSDTELKTQLVPLMHSELIKEIGEGGNLYLITVG